MSDEATVRSNGSAAGNAFLASFLKITGEQKVKERLWIEEMRQRFNPGFIHPDDGWVDRNLNTIHPCYPQYGYMADVGSIIILGTEDKWRAVRCTKVEPWRIRLNDASVDYHFEELPQTGGQRR